MKSSESYSPTTHCCVCLWIDNKVLVEATQTVRNLRVCDTHASVVGDAGVSDLAALFNRVKRVKR